MSDFKEVGQRIKSLRKAKQMTQEELGMRAGVKKATVSQWENATISSISGDALIDIADALGTTPQFIMRGYDEFNTEKIERTAISPVIKFMKIINRGIDNTDLQMFENMMDMVSEKQMRHAHA